jgi:ABC-2 type transport system permease protein
MATRAIKPKRDDTMLTGWQSMPERAPSVVREDRPTVTRIFAMAGVLLTAIGFLALIAPGRFNYWVSPHWGTLCLSLGVGLLLFHAFSEKDTQFRRTYASVGLTLIMISVALRALPFGGQLGGYFLSLGLPGLFLGLLFFLGVLRNETDLFWRTFLLRIVGILGGVMVVAGMVVGQFNQGFLRGEGILEMILGLFYISAFMAFQENEEISFQAGVALGLLGLATVIITLVRSFMPGSDFLIPSGFILMGFGLVYMGFSLGSVSDWPLVVLIRRELASYFYSPIAYLVFFGLLLIAWLNFLLLVEQLIPPTDPRAMAHYQPALEPIVGRGFINWITLIGQLFVVPVLCMRLMSEEHRSGTLEVLMTAPINETTVVLGKFFGVLLFYLFTWTPYWGEPFDYHPILSFLLALVATAGGFLSMGLFFSSITRNQIVAAVLTFVGMITFFSTFFLKMALEIPTESPWNDLLTFASFVDLWWNSLQGHLAPRLLAFHLSATVFFLFLTVKVLESRKWK